MRLIPLLMIALLLMGFAQRPSVVAALSSGHLLIEVAGEAISLKSATAELQPGAETNIRITVAKCVPLGILPCTEPVAVKAQAAIADSLLAVRHPPDYSDRFLRPPQT